jgi:N-acetyl-S-(2-succino)cysteine monooxygenase
LPIAILRANARRESHIFVDQDTSEPEAREKFEALQALVQPVVGVDLLSGLVGGLDLQGLPVDGPLPPLPETESAKSRQSLMLDLGRRENLTIRELYLRIAGARGHWQLVGTPEQIVDQIEVWYDNYGADGFNIMPPITPTGLTDFIELVIPELRRRNRFRSEYEGRTLRENLGLRVPPDHFVGPVSKSAAVEASLRRPPRSRA